MKKLFLVVLLLACAASLRAQMATIGATVTDGDGTVWANGSWSVSFTPNPTNPNVNVYMINGAAMNPAVVNQSGVLDGSGHFSTSVYLNTQITPVGSQWTLKVCPNAVTQCGIYTFAANGTPIDLSSSLTPVIPLPRFAPVAGTYGYGDFEAVLSLKPGSTYWNVTNNIQRCYNATTATWGVCNTSGGGSGVTEVDTDTASGINGGPILTTGTIHCSPASTTQYGCIKPDGVTITSVGGVISASGGGGGGGTTGNIASNAIFAFTGTSWLDDDAHVLAPNINVTTYSRSGSIVTVNTATSHNLTNNDWVNVRFLGSWPACTSPIVIGTGCTLFRATVTSGTQFTINVGTMTPANCAASCGFIESAMNNMPFRVTSQKGMPATALANTYMILGNPSIHDLTTEYNTIWHSKSPAVTGVPGYFLISDPWNDIMGCRTTNQIEGDYSTLLPQLHTDQWTVLVPTSWTRNVGTGFGAGFCTFPQNPFLTLLQLQRWFRIHGPSVQNSLTGIYWDMEPDFGLRWNDPVNTDLSYLSTIGQGFQLIGADVANCMFAGSCVPQPELPIYWSHSNNQSTSSTTNSYSFIPTDSDNGDFYFLNATATDYSLWIHQSTAFGNAMNFRGQSHFKLDNVGISKPFFAGNSDQFSIDSTGKPALQGCAAGTVLAADGTGCPANGGITTPTCNANGCYSQFSDGTYIMDGNSSALGGATSASNVTITFPVTLASTTNLFIQATSVTSATGDGNPHPSSCHVTRSSITTTGATAVISADVQIGGSGYANLAAGDYCSWHAYGK